MSQSDEQYMAEIERLTKELAKTQELLLVLVRHHRYCNYDGVLTCTCNCGWKLIEQAAEAGGGEAMSMCRICEGTGEDGICHECLQEWWENNSDAKALKAEIERLRAIVDGINELVNDGDGIITIDKTKGVYSATAWGDWNLHSGSEYESSSSWVEALVAAVQAKHEAAKVEGKP